MQDLAARREKLLEDAEDCELIGNLATDPGKREPFRQLASELKRLAESLGAEIARREGKDAP